MPEVSDPLPPDLSVEITKALRSAIEEPKGSWMPSYDGGPIVAHGPGLSQTIINFDKAVEALVSLLKERATP